MNRRTHYQNEIEFELGFDVDRNKSFTDDEGSLKDVLLEKISDIADATDIDEVEEEAIYEEFIERTALYEDDLYDVEKGILQ